MNASATGEQPRNDPLNEWYPFVFYSIEN